MWPSDSSRRAPSNCDPLPLLCPCPHALQALFFDGTVRISNWFSREVRLAEALAGSGSGALPLPPKLPQQLWQLHTLGCRVMHWVAGCRTHQLLPTGGASVDWRIFRELPNFQLMAAIKASLMAEHAGTQGCRCALGAGWHNLWLSLIRVLRYTEADLT